MTARILFDNGYYDSIVFAYYNKGWDSKVLVFNRDFTALQIVKLWIPDRNVFIYNADKEGWVTKRSAEGYDWILESSIGKLLKDEKNKEILYKCKELQATVKECEWYDIKNNTDIEGLMYASLDFHDSYVKKMYVVDGKQYIDFDTTWGCDILFELDGNVETNLFEDYGATTVDNEFFQIFDSTMFFQNNSIYWVDEPSVASFEEIQRCKAHYFCAENVKWKLIINYSAIWGKIAD